MLSYPQTHSWRTSWSWEMQAKDKVYWPGLNDQLEKMILNCELCLKYSQAKCKDYTSRFPILHKFTSMTGKHVANQCNSVFSDYGWPDTLISDNGPCYWSQTFTSVMQAFSVNHITSPLQYPQSNGLAEKYVQIVKSLFYKAEEEGKDFHKCLMIYCNTPLAGSLQMTYQCQMHLEITLDSSQKF